MLQKAKIARLLLINKKSTSKFNQSDFRIIGEVVGSFTPVEM